MDIFKEYLKRLDKLNEVKENSYGFYLTTVSTLYDYSFAIERCIQNNDKVGEAIYRMRLEKYMKSLELQYGTKLLQ